MIDELTDIPLLPVPTPAFHLKQYVQDYRGRRGRIIEITLFRRENSIGYGVLLAGTNKVVYVGEKGMRAATTQRPTAMRDVVFSSIHAMPYDGVHISDLHLGGAGATDELD